jgi:hypothetical protein
LNADGPELIAKVAVRFDGVAAVEQSHKIGGRKAILQLFRPTLRATRQERDSWTHSAGNLSLARGHNHRRSFDIRVGRPPTSP